MSVKDPVCGMTIDEKDAAGTSVYEGKTYYFCSPNCKEKFDKDPAAYAAKAGPEEKKPTGISQQQGKETVCPLCGRDLFPEPHTHAAKTEYTCPMHPEIRQPGPGACPKCGMALEPRTDGHPASCACKGA